MRIKMTRLMIDKRVLMTQLQLLVIDDATDTVDTVDDGDDGDEEEDGRGG